MSSCGVHLAIGDRRDSRLLAGAPCGRERSTGRITHEMVLRWTTLPFNSPLTSIFVRSEIALVGTKTGPRGLDLSKPFEKHHCDCANCETRCETSCAPVTLRVSGSA